MNRRTLFSALIGSAAAATAAPSAPPEPRLIKWAICIVKDGKEPDLGSIMLGHAGDRKDMSLLFDHKLEAQSYAVSFMEPPLWQDICIRRFELTEESLRQAWRPEYHGRIKAIFETTTTEDALTHKYRIYKHIAPSTSTQVP